MLEEAANASARPPEPVIVIKAFAFLMLLSLVVLPGMASAGHTSSARYYATAGVGVGACDGKFPSPPLAGLSRVCFHKQAGETRVKITVVDASGTNAAFIIGYYDGSGHQVMFNTYGCGSTTVDLDFLVSEIRIDPGDKLGCAILSAGTVGTVIAEFS